MLLRLLLKIITLITLCNCKKQKQQKKSCCQKFTAEYSVSGRLLHNGILVPGCFTTYNCIISSIITFTLRKKVTKSVSSTLTVPFQKVVIYVYFM